MQRNLPVRLLLFLCLLGVAGGLHAQRGGKPGTSTKAYRAAEIFTTESVLYGRFEFRMRAAAGSGVISNFFTWKEGSELTNVDWEELDIEVFGKDGATSWQSNIITAGNPRTTSEEVHAEPASLADGYHTYTLEWTPGRVTWLVDGVVRRTSTGAQAEQLISPAQLRFNIWPPNVPSWVGDFDPAVLPVHMFVSYVRYYRYVDGAFVFDWEDSFDSFDTGRWGKADWTFDENLAQFDPANALTADGKLVLGITTPENMGFSGTAPPDTLDLPYDGGGGTGGDGGGGGDTGGGGGTADGISPSAPGAVNITGADACSISLSWAAATDNVGVTGYRVYADGALRVTTTATSATVTGLTAGINYQFDVTAVDAAGNASAPSTAYARTKKRGCGTARSTAVRQIALYPNPVGEQLTVTASGTAITALALYTGDGRLVTRRSYAGDHGTVRLSVADVPVGAYFLRVTDAAGGEETRGVTVRR